MQGHQFSQCVGSETLWYPEQLALKEGVRNQPSNHTSLLNMSQRATLALTVLLAYWGSSHANLLQLAKVRDICCCCRVWCGVPVASLLLSVCCPVLLG